MLIRNKTEKIFILIPAHNEEKTIAQVIASLKNEGFENILVVNDGSRDKTAEKARSSGAEVLDQIINLGQGAALRTGIEYLRESRNPDIIVTFDADGQHQAKDINQLVQPIIENKCDIALGSRFLELKSNIPLPRKLILKAGVLFTNIVSNIKLTDTHNGLRALGEKAIKMIDISQSGMEHASEIIDQIRKKDLRYKEVPVEIVYTDYSKKKGQKSTAFLKIGIKVILKKLTK